MQYSIVNYSKVLCSFDARIDAEYYHPEHLSVDERLEKNKIVFLKNLTSKISDGTHFTPNYQETGIPFLSAVNIKENVLDASRGYKFISENEHLKIYKRCDPQAGDILLRKVGVGPRWACVVPDNLFEFSIFVSVALVRPDEKIINLYYLSTFINSDYGQKQLLRFNKGISQPDLHLEDIRLLKVPVFSSDFQRWIGGLVVIGNRKLHESDDLYRQAEQRLLSELGLTNWQPKHRLSFVKNYSETEQAERLDAEHFQPKYDELIEAITTNSSYSKKIAEIQLHNARGLQPKYAVDGEVDVITSKHILEHDLNYDGFEKTCESNWKKQKRARVQKGDILTYTTGANIGRTACYSISKPALASNHVNILRIRDENSEYFAFVMNSLIGRLQTERLSAGSAQAELYPKDIDKYLIPFTEEKTQQEIVASIKESRTLKAQSKHLLECAKCAVELAIEQDEQNAMDWLEKETGAMLKD